MNPNNNGQYNSPNPYSIDYLNQISASPEHQKSEMSPLKKLIFIAGGFLVFVTLLAVVVALIGGNKDSVIDTTSVTKDLVTLSTVTSISSTKIQDSDVSAANSNLSAFLSNALNVLNPGQQQTIQNQLTTEKNNANADIAAVDGTSTSSGSTGSNTYQPSTTSIYAKLENARLNAVFDSTYVSEVHYQLTRLQIQFTQLKSAATSSSQSNSINVLLSSLNTIINEFNSLNDKIN